MIFLLIPILAFIPALFWFFIFLREDRADPEPKRLIIKLFLLGGVSGIAAAILEFSATRILPSSLGEGVANFFADPTLSLPSTSLLVFIIVVVILFAAVEETLKITVVKEFAFYHSHFRQVVDGAIFGISAGLGFATLENIGYFFEANATEGIGALITVFFLRFFASTLLHAITTGISGYYLGKAKFSKNKKVFWQGLIAAILIHSAFNLFLFGEVLGITLNIIFLIILFVFFIRKLGSVEAQTIWGLVLLKNPIGKKS